MYKYKFLNFYINLKVISEVFFFSFNEYNLTLSKIKKMNMVLMNGIGLACRLENRKLVL